MSQSRTVITIALPQALFTSAMLFVFFTILNGYLLNLVSGYAANPWLVLLGVALEFAAVGSLVRGRLSFAFHPVELVGLIVVVACVWLYFVAASLPTLLPPTQSIDAVKHYLQTLFSYPRGTLVSWYPAGGAFVVAMLSHWTGWLPLRLLHPVAASFVALGAGAVYGITCALLPPSRRSKIAALAAPALLFVPWSYFAGIIDGEQYFYAQAAAQFFVLAALWYSVGYAANQQPFHLPLIGAALLGIVATYPYLVVLPVMLFAFIALAHLLTQRVGWNPLGAGPQAGSLRSSEEPRGRPTKGALAALFVFAALLAGAAIAMQHGGILEIGTAFGALALDVGEGGVTNPSVESMGGPIFLLLALSGVPLAWRAGARGRVILAFLVAWLVQLAALLLLRPVLQVSGYRIDKTFYILVFPLAILAALLPAWGANRLLARVDRSGRAAFAALAGTAALLALSVLALRPPVRFTPLDESELQVALWAKEHLDTYQINYLEPSPIRAYWLAFGLWEETLPNEWFQWIPAGNKLGPGSFLEWLNDPAWPSWLLVRDLTQLPAPPSKVLYQHGNAAIVEKQVSLGPAPAPQQRAVRQFGSTLRLLGYDLARTRLAPGEPVTLTTYVESLAPPPDTVTWRVQAVDREGRIVSMATGDPMENKYPVQRWPPGRNARDEWTLPMAPALTPGVYDLQIGLYRRENGLPLDAWYTDPTTGAVLGDVKPSMEASLARIQVAPVQPSEAEVRAATLLQSRVGDHFVLARYALELDGSRRPRLTLYWSSLARTGTDYTIFVHLVDSTGRIAAQKDAQPYDGRYPTSAWEPGEWIVERYEFVLPDQARAPLSFEIGMYAYPDLQRLAVSRADGNVVGDHIRIKVGIGE